MPVADAAASPVPHIMSATCAIAVIAGREEGERGEEGKEERRRSFSRK
jgi:hypothetical protein